MIFDQLKSTDQERLMLGSQTLAVWLCETKLQKETIKRSSTLLPIKNLDPSHKHFNRRHTSDCPWPPPKTVN